MRFNYFLPLLTLLFSCSKDDNSEKIDNTYPYKVFEYTPAPGQHINKFDTITTPEMACKVALEKLTTSSFISLGGFGGYIVVAFQSPIQNDGSYNIQIEGNSFSTSSEPAIVWVMSDTNNDSLPNDIWYELKGSEYNTDKETRDYSVTYTRPSTAQSSVQWVDNKGKKGTIEWNKYNNQDSYYPLWIKEEKYTLSGALLAVDVTIGITSSIAPLGWGYADNFSTEDRLCNIYGTSSKFNHFKISDAVTDSGQSANLSSVNFVKVVSAANQRAGIIGEVSTDIFSIKNYNEIKNNQN